MNPCKIVYLLYRFMEKGLKENGKPNLVLDLMRALMNVLVKWDTSNPDHPNFKGGK